MRFLRFNCLLSIHRKNSLPTTTMNTHLALVALSALAALGAQPVCADSFAPDLAKLAAGEAGKVANRSVVRTDKDGAVAVGFDERPGDGFAWWPEVAFADGTIEFDARGQDVFQKSFLGVAFHGLDEKTFDAVYFRPFNFRATDPTRRQHAVQYIAHPAFSWQRLRSERPEEFENPVEPQPDPAGWFHVRIVVVHPTVKVFVNDGSEPCLVVTQLSDRQTGWVGLWVGNGSGGEFANLRITPAGKE
jgi:hypothetical protein